MILVAERDQNVRELQKFFLEKAGFDVEFADDGQAALERARSAPPALVVTELLLPRLDGLALSRRLREDPRTAGVPVIVAIAHALVRQMGGGLLLESEPGAGSTFIIRLPLLDPAA